MPVYFCPLCNFDGDTHLATDCSQCKQPLPPAARRRSAAIAHAAPSPSPTSTDPFQIDPFTGQPPQSVPPGPPPDAFALDPFTGLPLQPAPPGPSPAAVVPDPYATPPVDADDEDQGLGDPFANFGSSPPPRHQPKAEAITGKFRVSELGIEPLEPPSSKAGVDYDPARVRGWLRCDPFDAVPLVEGMLTIGRSLHSGVILRHPSVSKTHAMIRALGDDLVIEDRSTYGTSVNGKRITTATIKPGDTLTIGPYTIEISAERFDGPKDDDTRPLPKLDSPEAMSGRIEKTPLDEILQQIEFYKKTGTVKVWTDGAAGVLVLYEGRPMFAEWNSNPPLTDQDALFAMLSLERGNFSFMTKVEAGEMTMSGTLTSLLMEFARNVDEA